MRNMEADPVTGDRYTALPWGDIGLSELAESKACTTVATTHFLLVEGARKGRTVVERLRLLGHVTGELFHGLDEADGRRLGEEWVTLLADVAACGVEGVEAWAAAYAESTGNYWPPGSSLLARGIVNAVLHSPEVERLHVGGRSTFFDEQVGMMCANWAGVSLVDEHLRGPDPGTWGLSGDDEERARGAAIFSAAPERFPAGWALIEALGRCLREQRSACPVALPDTGSADEAYDWLTAHAGEARMLDGLPGDAWPSTPTAQATVRHAWTAPTEDELRLFSDLGLVCTTTLTRISRNPLHLAAVLQWAVRTQAVIVTPNVLVMADEVGYRLRPVAPPSADSKRDPRQSFHAESWRDIEGLSDAHARVIALTPHGGGRVGRNDPCPCGSGAKYKRCHGG